MITEGMKKYLFLVLLVLGCVSAPGNGEVIRGQLDVRGAVVSSLEFPLIEEYDLIQVIYIESPLEYDAAREKTVVATYYGDAPFTYTRQFMRGDFDGFVGLESLEKYGQVFYVGYTGEIPMVSGAAYNIVWGDGSVLKGVSTKTREASLAGLDLLFGSVEALGGGDVEYLSGVGSLPAPPEEWDLYMVDVFYDEDYITTMGFYAQNDGGGVTSVDILIVDTDDAENMAEGRVKFLTDVSHVKFDEWVIYTGTRNGPPLKYDKMYVGEDVIVVASTPFAQKEKTLPIFEQLFDETVTSVR